MPGRSSSAASGCSGGSATRTESRSGSTASPSPVPPGAHVAALAQVDESLDILRAVGDRRTFGKVLWCSADINADLGDAETAAAQFEESLTLFVEFGDRWFCGLVLESAAFLAAEVGDAERAVSLLGAADAIWAALDVPLMARSPRTSRPGARRGTQPVGRRPLRGGLGSRRSGYRSAQRSSSSLQQARAPAPGPRTA